MRPSRTERVFLSCLRESVVSRLGSAAAARRVRAIAWSGGGGGIAAFVIRAACVVLRASLLFRDEPVDRFLVRFGGPRKMEKIDALKKRYGRPTA